jgi:hypothetical protein
MKRRSADEQIKTRESCLGGTTTIAPSHTVLGELDDRGIRFLTLRMRSAALMNHIDAPLVRPERSTGASSSGHPRGGGDSSFREAVELGRNHFHGFRRMATGR